MPYIRRAVYADGRIYGRPYILIVMMIIIIRMDIYIYMDDLGIFWTPVYTDPGRP